MPDILQEYGEFEGDEVLNENRHHLEPDELKRLFDVFKARSPRFWYPLFYIMYHFGCRVSEVRSIKREAIELNRRDIVIYRLKKRQWDKHKVNEIHLGTAKVHSVWPEAQFHGVNSWIDETEGEVGKLIPHKTEIDSYIVKVKNKSKGFKRFVYKIDDNLMPVIQSIMAFNEKRGLGQHRFLFPAFKKRKENAEHTQRMIAIGRLKGDHCISRTLCYLSFKQACEEAGIIPALAKTHTLRHTRATLLLSGGIDETQVQYLLGHESISTTRGYLGLAMQLRNKYNTLQQSNNIFGLNV